jgi:hypothetical protein
MPTWFIPLGMLAAPFLVVWYIGMYLVAFACQLAEWSWKSIREGHQDEEHAPPPPPPCDMRQ